MSSKINYIYELAIVYNDICGKPRWGQPHLSRAMKACKTILNYFKESPLKEFASEYDISVCAVRDICLWLQAKDMSFSLEGSVVKYMPNWEVMIQKYGCFKGELFK